MLRGLANITIKTLGNAVTGLLLITAIFIVLATRLTVNEVENMGRTWAAHDTGAAEKMAILAKLHNALGFGGMIHQFKNYLLRGDPMQFLTVQDKLFDITAAILSYPAHGQNPRKKAALAEIQGTVLRYADALVTAENMAEAGATAKQIYQVAKIDDSPAIAALRLLDDQLQKARTMSSKSVYRSIAVVEDLAVAENIIVTALLGLLIISFLWFTRARLVKPLARLGGTMEALAAGDHAVTIPDQDRGDEIGAMARTVQVFRENAIQRAHAEAALQESRQELVFQVEFLEQAQQKLERQGEDLTRLAEGLRVARDEADAANRAKSEFLAMMSHELRTPLNAVIGFSELIAGQAFGPVGVDRYLEYATDIGSSGQHLLDLINDILDLSKVESGVEELYEEEIELHAVAHAAKAMVKGRARKGKINLQLEIPDDLPRLHADQRKLKQILVNLLTNAIKFTDPGGDVTLKVWCRAESGCVFQIIDTGIGIAMEDIPKALSQFGQVQSGLDRSHEGTGLGLPLTKALVEKHGGSLDLQSKPGTGTTVTVRLPAERIVNSVEGTRTAA